MEISDFLVDEKESIQAVLKKIDSNGYGIAFVCKEKDHMCAVISDGDIRRYLLKKGDVEATANMAANYQPRFLLEQERTKVEEYFQKYPITAVPIVDDEHRIVEICLKNGIRVIKKESLNVPVVIMAGGKGTRLYPYTQILPKPLIPIGDKTITEHILDRFSQYGCNQVKMIVNYKKKFIETYFQESEQQCTIEFIEEETFWGTGGGLRLLLPNVAQTFFMTNCDILVEASYADIYHRHKREGNIITLVCAEKAVQIPYGTVEIDSESQVLAFKEKPTYHFLTNTGLYVIEPEFLEEIPENTFIHITDIIEKCIAKGKRVGIYSISEQEWMDMGQLEELSKMRERLK